MQPLPPCAPLGPQRRSRQRQYQLPYHRFRPRVVEAYDDPLVQGVTCYVSRARTGGVKGTLGIAEDPTEASIACRQVGAIHFTGPVKQQADVFSVSMSLIFKSLHVVRVVDAKRNTLVYLTYSDRVVSGSAKNSVSAVPMPAGTTIPVK